MSSAAAVAQGIVDAVTSGGLSAFQGVEALVVIGIGSAPALQSAAVSALATAIANNAPIATGAMTNIGFMINDGVATAGQAVTFLTQIAIAQPTTSSTVIPEIVALVVPDGFITGLDAATAMALAAHGLSATQQATIGAAIEGLFLNFGFTPTQQAGAAAAAAGAVLTADETIGVLAGFAAQGGAVLQVGIGVAIAGLVQAGTISANQAVTDLFQSFLVSGVTTAAQLNNVAVGLLSGGSTSAAVGLVESLTSTGLLETVSAVALVTSAAVAANTITALQVVDLAAGIDAASSNAANAAALISPLIASGASTGQAAVQELGNFVSASPNMSADEFMALVATLAAGGDAPVQTSIGEGLAAVIAGGALTYAQAAADLNLAVTGNAIQNIAPVLTVDQAVAVLIGVAASGLSVQAGDTIGALLGGGGASTQTAMTEIQSAVAGGILTPAQALKLLAGIVDGGTPVASAAVAMFQAGQINFTDLNTLAGAAITGTVPAAAVAFVLASIYPATIGNDIAQATLAQQLIGLISNATFTVSLSGGTTAGTGIITAPGVTAALLGEPVSGPGIPAGATIGQVVPGSFVVLVGKCRCDPDGQRDLVFQLPGATGWKARIVAALPPSTSLANLIGLLVKLGTSAGPVALGQQLFSVIESGAATADAVIAQIVATGLIGSSVQYSITPIFALGSLAQAAATAPAGSYAVDPATIENGVYTAIFATYPPAVVGFETNADFIAGGFWQLAAQGGLFTTTFFPVLVQLLARDTADFLAPVGSSFYRAVECRRDHLRDDLVIALSGAGNHVGAAAIAALAATIDVSQSGSVCIRHQHHAAEPGVRRDRRSGGAPAERRREPSSRCRRAVVVGFVAGADRRWRGRSDDHPEPFPRPVHHGRHGYRRPGHQ